MPFPHTSKTNEFLRFYLLIHYQRNVKYGQIVVVEEAGGGGGVGGVVKTSVPCSNSREKEPLKVVIFLKFY